MKKQPFFFEIKDNLIQFVRAMDDCIISRYNKDREVKDKIQVKYVYAPKHKVIHDIVNKSKHITLPVVAFHVTSISRDNDRVFNKHVGHYYRQDRTLSLSATQTNKSDYIPPAVPVNIDVSMSIMTKFQQDLDQIISNFVPYTNPYFTISWKVPEEFVTREQEIRTVIDWSESFSTDYPTDLSPTDPYFRITADTSFTIKGWLFKAVESPVNNILEIHTHWHSVSAIDGLNEDLTTTHSLTTFNSNLSSTIGRDEFICRARPQITYIDPITSCMTTGLSASFGVMGYSLENTFGVYVSGSNIFQQPSTTYDLYASSSSLSARFTAFDGVSAWFQVDNNNFLTFAMPPITGYGDVDLIIANKAGYAKIGTDNTQTELIHIIP